MSKNNLSEGINELLSDYQVLVNKIPGVISSKAIINESGHIIELHVLSDMTRGPKQISRDIQSALLAGYGIRLDHKIISIAQIDKGQNLSQNFRLNLQGIRLSSEGPKAQAKVVLSKDDSTFEGFAEGGNSANARMRLVAEATLSSVHAFLNIEYVFVLADVTKFTISQKTAFCVAVSHISNSGEELLIGSSLVKQDESEAVVKATLDAINRKIVQYYLK